MPIIFIWCSFLQCDLSENITKKREENIRGEGKMTRVEWTNKIIVVHIERIINE